MPKFLVRQRRPVTVCFIQEVEADSPEEAEDKFHDEFDPEHAVIEGALPHAQFGPVEIFSADKFANPKDVAAVDLD